jgi:carbonic anhydrase
MRMFILVPVCLSIITAGSLAFTGCDKSVEVVREEEHWEYEHPDWQNIGYAECGTKAQSPINVPTDKAVRVKNMEPIEVQYTPAPQAGHSSHLPRACLLYFTTISGRSNSEGGWRYLKQLPLF